jgi:hypothetical protein
MPPLDEELVIPLELVAPLLLVAPPSGSVGGDELSSLEHA